MDNKKIAILIDAENISYKNARQIIDTMSEKGDVVVKELIADWSKIVKSRLSSTEIEPNKFFYREKQIEGWRKEAAENSMTALQQFSYVAGKNSSDMALAIRAMNLLYERPFITSFCLVSNDSDFTRLAQELREHGKEVIGMGERNKAVREFVNAFSEFIYLGETIDEQEPEEMVKQAEELPKQSGEAAKVPENKNSKQSKNNTKKVTRVQKWDGNSTPKKAVEKKSNCPIPEVQLNSLIGIISDILEEHEGIAYYSLISLRMKKLYADFVPANYDCRSISVLIDKLMPYLPMFQKEAQPIPNNPNGSIMMLKKRTK